MSPPVPLVASVVWVVDGEEHIDTVADVTETPSPTADELRLLREELDPDGISTK